MSRETGRISVSDGMEILTGGLAPWVRDLGLVVEEVGDSHAVLRLPWSTRLAREGGAMSGQALMAAADTATVVAVCAARGGYGPMTTVQQSTTFQRAIVGSDVLITARVTKIGRSLAFIDVTMTAESTEAAGTPAPAAHASTVYALQPLPEHVTQEVGPGPDQAA
ncbi:MAG TPA: PaaI family thioesterase [Actinocrinis sp.]|uniref:PaaI family thioesterase n=1 Tax=Actinocrinis sp. TaxID=1920516 RepID=UPI002DDDBB6E|nr:PaaI family thioesterase [Actinocrinis sp.]HEV2346273.1 PaaI family thioesterase [Actinocrinis sp.]